MEAPVKTIPQRAGCKSTRFFSWGTHKHFFSRLAYLTQGDKVDADDLAFVLPREEGAPGLLSMDLALADATREFQVEYIKSQISRSRGSMTAAAKRLGLHRSNLYRKMRQLKMQTDEDEEPS